MVRDWKASSSGGAFAKDQASYAAEKDLKAMYESGVQRAKLLILSGIDRSGQQSHQKHYRDHKTDPRELVLWRSWRSRKEYPHSATSM
jgi:hypothetical protein